MKIDRGGLARHEDEDLTRHQFAQGSLLLRGLADRLSATFCAGMPLMEADLRAAHEDLYRVWRILVSETLDGIAPSGVVVDEEALEYYHSCIRIRRL